MEKMTKRDYFATLLTIDAVAADAKLVAFIEHEMDLLARKNSARKGELTETQKENLEHQAAIVEFMAGKDSAVTIAEVRKHFGMTAQKVTPLMTALVKAGKVTKVIEKRVSYYSLAVAE